MSETKKKKSSVIFYVIFTIFMALIIWPTGRIFIQQQLMKIGLFQPDLKDNAEETNASSAVGQSSPSVKQDKAIFVNEAKEQFDTEKLKGKVLFINFWATWCPPCRAEMPSIQKLVEKFQNNDKIAFLIVEIESNADGTHKFLKENNIDLPIVYPASDIPSNWLDGSIPSTVILDKNGNLAVKKEGMFDYSSKDVQDYIQNLIDQ